MGQLIICRKGRGSIAATFEQAGHEYLRNCCDSKERLVHGRLNEMMRAGRIRKFYTAVVEGIAEPEKGVIDKPIGKDEADSIRRKVRNDGQQAVTVYDTLKRARAIPGPPGASNGQDSSNKSPFQLSGTSYCRGYSI